MRSHELHLHWFSGSGNTLAAAVAFADRLRELDWTVELRPMETAKPRDFDPEAVCGFAFPTYAFSIPEIVRSFVASLPNVNKTAAIMLGTHGAFSGGVCGPMKRIVRRKGFRAVAGRIITMPDSFFPYTGKSVNDWLMQRAIRQTREYADHFNALYRSDQTDWAYWPVVSDLFGAFFGTFFASRRWCGPLHTTVHADKKRCTRCGDCVRFCPVGALEMKTKTNSKLESKSKLELELESKAADDFPKPDLKCVNCLRCVAVCRFDAMRHAFGFYPYRHSPAETIQGEIEARLASEHRSAACSN